MTPPRAYAPREGDKPNTEAEQLIRDRVELFFNRRHFRTEVVQGTGRGADVECWQEDELSNGVPKHWRIEAKGWHNDDANRRDSFLSGVTQALQLIEDPTGFPIRRDITPYAGYALSSRLLP